MEAREIVGAGQAAGRWVVVKYGGTSVGTAGNWPTIAGTLQRLETEGYRVLMVHSALSRVSDTLEKMAQTTAGTELEALLGQVTKRHEDMATELGIALTERAREYLAELGRICHGIALTGETSPRLHARIMAFGELLATEIAVRALEKLGLAVQALDARDLLRSEARPLGSRSGAYLAAACSLDAVRGSMAKMSSDASGIVVTQGFIASNAEGETVLLGRGGSDTSAAYFAYGLGAARLEIWTDVPGMFSANPRQIRSARMLKQLDYAEAQEIAATGAKVLHPQCLPIARRANIPVHVCCTQQPDIEGTRIFAGADRGNPRVKAVSSRKGITLVSMETVGMWQEAGFLARAFQAFGDLGLSVDLVSTSESVVSLTLDPTPPTRDKLVLDQLRQRLEEFCRVRIRTGCATISMVGSRIRANLHKLAPALELFHEHDIFLVSQAASDLNFTVVVDEEQADRLVKTLHELVVREAAESEELGPSWEMLQAEGEKAETAAPWWSTQRQALLSMMEERDCAYVYHLQSIRERATALQGLGSFSRIFYAIKANSNVEVLQAIEQSGLGFECVSPGELARVQEACPGLDADRLLFTPNFAPESEYRMALEKGIRLTLDNLYPLEHWPALFQGRDVLVRVDLGHGSGHHRHVRTAGLHSKFGVPVFEMPRLIKLCDRLGAKITGLHTHAGSGIMDPTHWQDVAVQLAEVASNMPDVRSLDLGGGIGVPDKPEEDGIELARIDGLIAEVAKAHPRFEFWLEPGRFLVAQAGVLLARVTQTKGKGKTRYIGVSTGMNSLIRPALYGAYHHIVNLSRMDVPAAELATVVGPICESGDKLGRDRWLPVTEEGDVLLIANAGAYGAVMSSRYNLREPAPELSL